MEITYETNEQGEPVRVKTFPNGAVVRELFIASAMVETLEIPMSLTRAQARAALIITGRIEAVQPIIDAIADPTQRALAQNDWDNRLMFERDNPTLLYMAMAMGLTEADLDDLFILGATL